MENTATMTDYDSNAPNYDQFRRPSPIIKTKLLDLFSGCKGSILSLGCGTARMEKEISLKYEVIGLDRSIGMLNQVSARLERIVQGDMSYLPFPRDSFHGLYFMQSLHHIGANLGITPEMRAVARKEVLKEAIRVLKTGPLAIIQRDPMQNQAVWFWRYFPQALETKLKIQPKVSILVDWLREMGLQKIEAYPINDPMAKGYYDPASPLDPKFRQSFSEFSYLTKEQISQGLTKLKEDIRNGNVTEVIAQCKHEFKEIGGTVYFISAYKIRTPKGQ